MASFRCHSNCTSRSMFPPFAQDTNSCQTKKEALSVMRNYEKELVNIIEETTDCTAPYYIIGNKKVVATAFAHDNAILLAEALISESPYYSTVDVVSREGLRAHLLK